MEKREFIADEIKKEALMGKIKLENELLANPIVNNYLKSHFGENSIKVISVALEETTDDAIAAKCKLRVAEVRAILNKLYNYNMAEYKRIKDRDTGWFSYLWRIDISHILNIIKEEINKEIKMLDEKIERLNTELLYYCPQCSKANLISFDLASDLFFRCPNCESKLLEKQNNAKEDYENELNTLKKNYISLLNDIERFEILKKLEEARIQQLQKEMTEMTRINELSVGNEKKERKRRKSIRERSKNIKKKKGDKRRNENNSKKQNKNTVKNNRLHKKIHKTKAKRVKTSTLQKRHNKQYTKKVKAKRTKK